MDVVTKEVRLFNGPEQLYAESSIAVERSGQMLPITCES